MFTFRSTKEELNHWLVFYGQREVGELWKMPVDDSWTVQLGKDHEPVVVSFVEDLMLYLKSCADEFAGRGCGVVLIDKPDNKTQLTIPDGCQVTGIYCRLDGQYFLNVEADWLPVWRDEQGTPLSIFKSIAALEEYRASPLSGLVQR